MPENEDLEEGGLGWVAENQYRLYDPDEAERERREKAERAERERRQLARTERNEREAKDADKNTLKAARGFRRILERSYRPQPIALEEADLKKSKEVMGRVKERMDSLGIGHHYGEGLHSYRNKEAIKRSPCPAWKLDKTEFQREQWAVPLASLALAAGVDLLEFAFEKISDQESEDEKFYDEGTRKRLAKDLANGAHELQNRTPTDLTSSKERLGSEMLSRELIEKYYWGLEDDD